jgi:peptidoglycan/xylan/chitin deacetylase (PgdA/CDA1 family)
MGFFNKLFKRNIEGIVAPNQYYNPTTDDYEVIHGSNGAANVTLAGSNLTDYNPLPVKKANPTNRGFDTHIKISNERLAARSRFLKSELNLLDSEKNHGWSQSGGGALTEDTTYKESGSQSLKMTTPVGGTTYAKKIGPFDLSSFDHFRFWARRNPVKNINSISFLFYCPNGSNYFRSPHFMGDLNQPYGVEKEISFSKADCASVGSPNWSNCTEIYIELTAATGEVAELWFDNFKAQKSVVTKGKVLLRFDDGDSSVFSTAKPIMEDAGLPGNCVVIPKFVGGARNGNPCMSISELRELHMMGWDISSHSWNHADFDVRSSHQAYNDLKATQNFLIENGFAKGSRTHVFPGHLMNESTFLAASKLFHINNSGLTRHETLPWGNPLCLNYQSGDQKTATQLKTLVDTCASNNTLLIIMFHRIVPGGAAYTTNPTEFTNFINYLAGLDAVDVITYSDLIDGTWIATR